MWAIYDAEDDVYATILEEGGVDWHKSCCEYTLFETEQDAINACIENEINVDWVVED